MAGSIQRTYKNFSGGQNNFAGIQASPVIVDNGDNEALMFAHSSVNWEMAENGLIKYGGYTSVLDSAMAGTPYVTGLYDWNGVMITCGGGKVFTVSGGTATQIYTGHTAGKYYQFTEWDDGAGNEILIMCNGTDTPLYYDGTTCTTITFTDPSTIWDNAKPQGAAIARGRIFFWGDPTHPHRIYTPRPGTYNNFDNTTLEVDAFDVDAGFGGVLTGVKALTDDIIIVYKQRAIRRLSGVSPFDSTLDPFELKPVSDEFGCIAPRSIVQVGIDQYFLSEDGYRRFKPVQEYGDIDPQQPTYPIQGIMDDLNYSSNVIINACAVFHKPTKQIWLSVPDGSSTTNNKIIIHDVITGGNDPRTSGEINAGVLATFSRKVYHGDYAGQLHVNGTSYTYNGVTFEADWESKWIAHNGIGRRKCYREMHVYAESDGEGSLICQTQVLKRNQIRTVSTTEQIDSGDSAWDVAVWDTGLWSSGEQNIFKIKNLGRGNALKIRLINTAGQSVKVRQIDLFYDVFSNARG